MLGVERGVSNFGQLIGFQREFESVLATARGNGSTTDPDIAARIADAWIGLQVMRFTAEDTLAVPDPGAAAGGVAAGGVAANIAKLLWAPWHQRLGELAADVTGADATLAGPGYDLTDAQRLSCSPARKRSSAVERDTAEHRRRARLGLPRG